MPIVHELKVLPSKERTIISMEVLPEEVELAFATNGASLQQAVMLALMAALTVQTAEPDVFARYLPWYDPTPEP